MSAPDKGFKSLPGWLGDFKVLFNYIFNYKMNINEKRNTCVL